MKRPLILLLLMLCLSLLTACNTIGGVGRDVESVGDEIGDAAED
ncbi:MAG: entericidin [Xanthomonadaceae bacterium]|nr:entericidin [Xanthomonadaceae bacterium]MDP2184335.1 entericidin [Xanthomonadales bacterium]MDZ4116769.1 entericidin [Xanthomonadaceae bacterium]MDZ4377642.1 entericidin [Xanthomonadaceae bacterium]